MSNKKIPIGMHTHTYTQMINMPKQGSDIPGEICFAMVKFDQCCQVENKSGESQGVKNTSQNFSN